MPVSIGPWGYAVAIVAVVGFLFFVYRKIRRLERQKHEIDYWKLKARKNAAISRLEKKKAEDVRDFWKETDEIKRALDDHRWDDALDRLGVRFEDNG